MGPQQPPARGQASWQTIMDLDGKRKGALTHAPGYATRGGRDRKPPATQHWRAVMPFQCWQKPFAAPQQHAKAVASESAEQPRSGGLRVAGISKALKLSVPIVLPVTVHRCTRSKTLAEGPAAGHAGRKRCHATRGLCWAESTSLHILHPAQARAAPVSLAEVVAFAPALSTAWV